MTFFDTLKDENVKSIFGSLAWHKYSDGRTLNQIMADMTFDERLNLFQLTHAIMKSLGMPGWQEPMYLNREEPLDYTADA